MKIRLSVFATMLGISIIASAATGLKTRPACLDSWESYTAAKTDMTLGGFLQSIYDAEVPTATAMTYQDWLRLLQNAAKASEAAARRNALPDVPYTCPHGQAIYYALANGYLTIPADGLLRPNEPLTEAVFDRIRQAILQEPVSMTAAEAVRIFSKICSLRRTSRLQGVISDNLFRKTTWILDAPDLPDETRQALCKTINAIRAGQHAARRNVQTLTGSPENQMTWIFRYPNGPIAREFHFKSKKKIALPIEISILNDTHFNLVNAEDEAEANPAIMSTREFRLWLRDGGSRHVIATLMDFCAASDQILVNGDILDFLSWGARELTTDVIFHPDVNVMATLGGHDTTRVMQGKVGDPSSLESRWNWLQEFWPHDIFYASRILRDNVMLIAMDNGGGHFWDHQIPKLKADLQTARDNNLIVFIFAHEPICSRNPDEQSVTPIRANDPYTENFFARYSGNDGSQEATRQVYGLITRNADIIGAYFAGHAHCDFYSEIIATKPAANPEDEPVPARIPQIILTGSIYDGCGHIGRIIIE